MRKGKIRVVRREPGTKRILVTGDIHGNLGLLKSLLQKMEYRPGADALVIAGDLIQKGTENLETLHYIMRLAEHENVFPLLGNNDYFVFNGPDWRLLEIANYLEKNSILWEMSQSIGVPAPKNPEEMHALREKVEAAFPAEFAFLRGLPHILETERFLFAHAGLESEDLDAQDPWYVISAERFHESAYHTFSKLLVVGHWPTANYRQNVLSNAPVFHKERNILSMDGGNRVKILGALNGIILDNETGAWDWVDVDEFPKIKAPCSQKGRPGLCITWPENYVEIVERDVGFSVCRDRKTGGLFDIPNEFLYEDCGDGVFRTNDICSARLEVQEGEEVSLVWRGTDRQLIMKNGEAGFLFSGLTDQAPASYRAEFML